MQTERIWGAKEESLLGFNSVPTTLWCNVWWWMFEAFPTVRQGENLWFSGKIILSSMSWNLEPFSKVTYCTTLVKTSYTCSKHNFLAVWDILFVHGPGGHQKEQSMNPDPTEPLNAGPPVPVKIQDPLWSLRIQFRIVLRFGKKTNRIIEEKIHLKSMACKGI